MHLQVRQELARVRGSIGGVPHFIIDKQHQLSGAQDPSAFLSAFEQV